MLHRLSFYCHEQESLVPQVCAPKGASLVWHKAIKHAHTFRVSLKVNVTERAPMVRGNHFFSRFIFPPLHYWKGHAARHSGRLRVVQRGRIRRADEVENSHGAAGVKKKKRSWLKPSYVSSFISSSENFLLLGQESSTPWSAQWLRSHFQLSR